NRHPVPPLDGAHSQVSLQITDGLDLDRAAIRPDDLHIGMDTARDERAGTAVSARHTEGPVCRLTVHGLREAQRQREAPRTGDAGDEVSVPGTPGSYAARQQINSPFVAAQAPVVGESLHARHCNTEGRATP